MSNSLAALAARSNPDGSKFDQAFGFGGSSSLPLPSPASPITMHRLEITTVKGTIEILKKN